MSTPMNEDAAAKVGRSSLGEPAARRLRSRTSQSVRDDLVRRIESARESNRKSTYSSGDNSNREKSGNNNQEAT